MYLFKLGFGSDHQIAKKQIVANGSIGIAPTFLKMDLWSPGAGCIPIISTKGINQIKKGNFKKKVGFYAYKKIKYIF